MSPTKVKPAAKPTKAKGTVREAVAWAAIEYRAGKRTERDLLKGGASYDLDLKIKGTVAGGEFSDEIIGRLTVGEDSMRASSSKANAARLLAVVAKLLNDAERERVFAALVKEYRKKGEVAVDKTVLGQCNVLLKKLGDSKKKKPKRGDVCLVGDDEAPE